MSQPLDHVPEKALEAIEYDREQWATPSVLTNPFYTDIGRITSISPRHSLQREQAASTSLFSLPPATSLSRFIYQSQDLNGTKIPVSVYILWPHTPRRMPDE